MTESSLFLIKNSLGAKMKSGFRNFCNGESSTSTLDHHHHHLPRSATPFKAAPPPQPPPPTAEKKTHHQPTLEEMILQLEMEEQLTARRNATTAGDHHHHNHHHRMSCVNSSDILRSARNALNQYPRFSLDGKDSMYRSSFTNLDPLRSDGRLGLVECKPKRFPDVVGGESVIWCKPGVVGRLMGLEAIPIPLNSGYRRERLSAIIKRQNLRRRAQIEAINGGRRSCSRSGYCVMKPLEMEVCGGGEGGWPMRRRFM